jgi:molybdopterin converting factor small subunit
MVLSVKMAQLRLEPIQPHYREPICICPAATGLKVDRCMNLHLKLYGVFRTAAGINEVELNVPDQAATVRTVIHQLLSESRFEALKQLLVDNGSSDPRPNTLIMVSGREINSLKGLDTELSERDELTFLPIAHGG